MFTDGLARRGVESGWAYSARKHEVVMVQGSGAFALTALGMCMKVRAISEVIVSPSRVSYVSVKLTRFVSKEYQLRQGRVLSLFVTNACFFDIILD